MFNISKNVTKSKHSIRGTNIQNLNSFSRNQFYDSITEEKTFPCASVIYFYIRRFYFTSFCQGKITQTFCVTFSHLIELINAIIGAIISTFS